MSTEMATEAAKTTAKKGSKGVDPEKAALETAAAARFEEFEALLREFVEVPSVSMDPAKSADMQKMAELARATLERFGFETQLLPTKGQPLVFGRKVVDPAAPTVTIYNHMDVQPGGDRD